MERETQREATARAPLPPARWSHCTTTWQSRAAGTTEAGRSTRGCSKPWDEPTTRHEPRGSSSRRNQPCRKARRWLRPDPAGPPYQEGATKHLSPPQTAFRQEAREHTHASKSGLRLQAAKSQCRETQRRTPAETDIGSVTPSPPQQFSNPSLLNAANTLLLSISRQANLEIFNSIN